MLALENIYTDLDAKNFEELFIKMSEIYEKKGYVNSGYLEALIDREKKYPTGLKFENHNIAIPHAYPEYIKKENIVFIRLNNDIDFLEMGTLDEKLSVRIVIMLLIKKGEEQVKVLLKLMNLFENNDNYVYLLEETDDEKIYEFLKSKLK